MNSKACAFCKSFEAPTREHLWPASLHSRLVAANENASHIFWLARLQKEIPSEPQIRDVCAHCNNVVLSKLDEYICRLFDSTLVRIPVQNEQVVFEYDYHLLKRWLLKLCFNSARIHNSRDLQVLEMFLPYIMGNADKLGRSIQLFLLLSYPQEIPKEDFPEDIPPDSPMFFSPTMNRVGFMFFYAPNASHKLLRAVHLRSFTFTLAFFKPDERREVLTDFVNYFSQCTGAVLLRPSQPKVELLYNGFGAWTLFKGSRSNGLVFDDDVGDAA